MAGEGHARTGDIRVAKFGGGSFDWIPAVEIAGRDLG